MDIILCNVNDLFKHKHELHNFLTVNNIYTALKIGTYFIKSVNLGFLVTESI